MTPSDQFSHDRHLHPCAKLREDLEQQTLMRRALELMEEPLPQVRSLPNRKT